jgi:BMFP domain-containing protein YqiC
MQLTVATPQKIADATVSQDNQTGNQLQQIDQYNQAPSALPNNPENRQLQQIEQYNQAPSTPVGQVTSVSQLSDVQPTDWAFQALQSLVERYGCIAGYPDGTYRGNRAMTRYEFAAGLNACLNRVNELIASATSDLVRKEDLATLQRLQEEFAAELATLRGRVDALEARTAELEANQFSTTTKLAGEVIFSPAAIVGDNKAVPSGRAQGSLGTVKDNAVFSDRVRLSLNTSFFGQDLLRTRLQARNTTQFSGGVTGTNMTRLGYDGDEANTVEIDQLFYRVPFLNGKVVFQVDAANTELNERGFNTYSPLESSGRGSISRYGRFSPIYRQSAGSLATLGSSSNTQGPSPGISFALNPQGPIGVNLAYIAPTGNNPNRGDGIFDGAYSAIGQINFQPIKQLGIGLTYAHTYDTTAINTRNVNLFSSTGSLLSNQPFGNVPTTSNNYGLEGNFKLGKTITLFGWGGYTQAIAERSPSFSTTGTNTPGTTLTGPSGAKADIWYWAGGVSFQDLAKQGSLLSFLVGQPPKVTANGSVQETFVANGVTVTRHRVDSGTSLQLEGEFRYPITDNIDITPGVFVILNPENNNANDTEYVGTLRTTFRF